MNPKNQLERLPDFIYVIIDAKWTDSNELVLILHKEFYNEHITKIIVSLSKPPFKSYEYRFVEHEGNMLFVRNLSVHGDLPDNDFIGGLLFYESDIWANPAFRGFDYNNMCRNYDKAIHGILKLYGINKL